MKKLRFDCTLFLLSGKDSPVHRENAVSMKLPYVPPYSEFALLRHLELKIRRTAERMTPNTLVLDITEWVEHPYDDYFDIMAKYFHDHAHFHLIFTAHAERTDAMPLFTVLRTFLPIHMEEDITFRNETTLAKFLLAHYRFTERAAGFLARLVMRDEGEPLRSYAILDSLPDELTEEGNDTVHCKGIMASMNDTSTLLGTLFGNTDEINGGNGYDYEKAI